MKGTKKYSKSTNKKAIDTAKDPYLLKVAPGELAVCKKCEIVYYNKRWVLAEEFDSAKVGEKKITKVLCPACQKILLLIPGR